jgi:hypothetical protein
VTQPQRTSVVAQPQPGQPERPAVADCRALSLTLGHRVRTRFAGLFLFLPLLARVRFDPDQLTRVARRRTVLERNGHYQAVPELEQALGLLKKEKFEQMVVFLESSAGQRVRTNNHVERANRKLRFAEKVRYKWRSLRSLDRFLHLRLGWLDSPEQDEPSAPRPDMEKPSGKG